MKRNIFDKAEGEDRIFKDERYLYPEFVPERLSHRDSEINSLVYAFNPVAKGGKPHNVFVTGTTGTGKTVSVKYVLNELEEYSDRAKKLYLNCFEYNSRHAILAAIANFLGAPLPRRGLATDEIYSKMLEAMKKVDFFPIIILDEIDQIMNATESSNLLYDLLRVIEYQRNRFGLAIISNDPAFTAKLDSRVKSSLAEETVVFNPYTPIQIKDILKERANYAFQRSALSEEVIPVAAAHAAKRGGDARVAIEALWKAGREAERENAEKVELKHLKKAFELVDSVSALKHVKELDNNEKAVLKIIAEFSPIASGEMYEKYCASEKEPLSQRRVSEFITNLEKRNLVSAALISMGNKGKTRQISLTTSKEAVLKELTD